MYHGQQTADKKDSLRKLRGFSLCLGDFFSRDHGSSKQDLSLRRLDLLYWRMGPFITCFITDSPPTRRRSRITTSYANRNASYPLHISYKAIVAPPVNYQLAFFTPGILPASAFIRNWNLAILKSLKTPRPFPPIMHRFRICVGRV